MLRFKFTHPNTVGPGGLNRADWYRVYKWLITNFIPIVPGSAYNEISWSTPIPRRPLYANQWFVIGFPKGEVAEATDESDCLHMKYSD